MANEIILNDVRIQLKGDTAQNWRTNNPVLLRTEMGVENDTRKFKFGDGTTAWVDLEYAGNAVETGKTQAPTVDDADYSVGTIWVDETNKKAYIMLGVTDGSATWKQIVTPDDLSDLGAGDMLKAEFANNPKASQGYVNAAIKADSADKLGTPVQVSITGDVTAEAQSFDGSTNLILNAILASVVSAGTYCKVKVNDKGIVTGFETLSYTDVQGLGTAATKDAGSNAGNVVLIGEDGKIDENVLPALAITNAFPVDSEEAMLGLTAQTGDIAIRSDVNKSYILSAEPASTVSNWLELRTPTDAVLSVNSKTGAVILTTDDIAEGSNNLYFTEARATSNFNTNFANKNVTDLADGGDVLKKNMKLILNCGNSVITSE